MFLFSSISLPLSSGIICLLRSSVQIDQMGDYGDEEMTKKHLNISHHIRSKQLKRSVLVALLRKRRVDCSNTNEEHDNQMMMMTKVYFGCSFIE